MGSSGQQAGLKSRHYVRIDVWAKTADGAAICFRCFQVFPERQYCVQSADIFHDGENQRQKERFEEQFLDLFVDEAPDERSGLFDSLEAAIADHKSSFLDADSW